MSRIPTFMINLAQAKERREFTLSKIPSSHFDIEVMEAVNGSQMSQEEIDKLCDVKALEEHPTWLTRGAIGCSLSHLYAYEAMIEREIPVALIIEDDKDYPANFHKLCEKTIPLMGENEVALLYYESKKVCGFSSQSAVEIDEKYKLVYPIDADGPITTGAYLVTLEAAKKLAAGILPVRVAADTWHYFLSTGMLGELRCVFPLIVVDANFKSDIGYRSEDSIIQRITDFIDRKKIPLLYSLLKLGRKNLRKKRLQFELVNQEDYRSGSKL